MAEHYGLTEGEYEPHFAASEVVRVLTGRPPLSAVNAVGTRHAADRG
ncbi:MAG TPA: hypothetical protein VH912_33210 [Streptosporangiaceae bacterium]